MANSSDWIGTLTGFQEAEEDMAPQQAGQDEIVLAQPGWLALLGDSGEFRETLPFGAPAPAPPAPAPQQQPLAPLPDPHADARGRAFADGEAAGRAAAEAQAQSLAARQRALRLSFRTLDEAALAILSQDLADTVAALCDGALAACAVDHAALLQRCQAAAARIGGAADALRLHLHPDDIAGLQPEALSGWQVVPDAALEPGALMIEGPDGVISDGPAEWRRAIAAAVAVRG